MKKIVALLFALALIASPGFIFAADKGLHLGGLGKDAKKAKIEAKKSAQQSQKDAEKSKKQALKEAEKRKKEAEKEKRKAEKEAEKRNKEAERELNRHKK